MLRKILGAPKRIVQQNTHFKVILQPATTNIRSASRLKQTTNVTYDKIPIQKISEPDELKGPELDHLDTDIGPIPENIAQFLKDLKSIPAPVDMEIIPEYEEAARAREEKELETTKKLQRKMGRLRLAEMSKFYFEVEFPWNQTVAPVVDRELILELLKLPITHVQRYYLIDVRSEKRRIRNIIPRSVSLPLFELSRGALRLGGEQFFEKYGYPKPETLDPIICFSDDPHDSEIATYIFNMEDYASTFNYRGGVQDYYGDQFKELYTQRKYDMPMLMLKKIGTTIPELDYEGNVIGGGYTKKKEGEEEEEAPAEE